MIFVDFYVFALIKSKNILLVPINAWLCCTFRLGHFYLSEAFSKYVSGNEVDFICFSDYI